MSKILSLIVCLLFCISVAGQTLPVEWEGVWSGQVDLWSNNQNTRSFPMSLDITPRDSTWNFEIAYLLDADKPDIRSYELVPIDEDKSRFAIDEKNSILLDTYYNGNCLYTGFGVMTSALQTRICFENGALHYEITSYRSEPIRVSGNEIIEQDTIPEVQSYELYQTMKATLVKKGN